MWTGEAGLLQQAARTGGGWETGGNAKEEDQVSEMAEKTREERERDANYCSEG